MTGLTRYILRQCIGVMIFVTAALCAAVWLAQSLRLIDLIVNRGLSAELFLYLALLILPRFIEIVLPIGVFIAVLFVFNRLSSESELVVMRAAGVGPAGLARPVLVLAGMGFVILLVLSAYLLPASNREFKDAQFEIRNRFVSSLLQEGAFTTISDKATIYIASRDNRGEVVGVLIDDERDKNRPVTILAQRGAFTSAGGGSRLVMVNGDRQEYNRTTGKLSILSFDRYTLDLDTMRDAPVVRFREPQERYLGELLFPPPGLDPAMRYSFIVEANQRLAMTFSVFGFAMIPLACLLPGEINRRGQLRRVLLAITLAFIYQSVGIGVQDLASRYGVAIPLMYLIDLLPVGLGFGILLRGGIRLGRQRPVLAAAAP
ncbi:MAG TPA: LPS export ABC transporter permease LptF [Stellaceae bacterium]|nr:LPS export ABC transporter permease LptF [Stellaceae bacterium]